MENKVLDYEIVEDIAMLLESDVIIYGTSGRAEHLYPLLKRADLNVVACCDGSENKIGRKFHQWKIEFFADVISRIDASKTIIIVCSSFVKEIMADCRKVCTNNLKFVTSYGFKTALFLNRNNSKVSIAFRNWYNEKCNIWFKLSKKEGIAKVQLDYNRKLIHFMDSDPILVYQMGKVGSTGIYHSLQSAKIDSIHLHYFQPWNNHIPADEYKEYLDILKQIICRKRKIKIITLLRDPLVRDISTFFQTFPNVVDEMGQNIFGLLEDNITRMLYLWISPKDSYLGASGLYMNMAKDEDFCLKDKISAFSWFDMELKKIFNIDIYEYPFDKERGYSIINQDTIECLVIKLEKLDACHNIIREFVNRKDLQIHSDNIGANKEYGYLYNEVKRKILIPQELIDFYYNSEELHHFYTETEIAKFRNYWTRE